VILLEKFGNGQDILYESKDGERAEELPLVVLINEGSASASEVLAGAIRDQQRGILIGSASFGKGTVQTWESLSNGGGVRITIARWLTPDGSWVHGEGIQPDIHVTLSETFEGVTADAQLQAAISYLNEQSLSELQAETQP
jgi:carboxyl-terminal processing protease